MIYIRLQCKEAIEKIPHINSRNIKSLIDQDNRWAPHISCITGTNAVNTDCYTVLGANPKTTIQTAIFVLVDVFFI